MKKIIITLSFLLICSLSFSQNKKEVEDIKLEIIELRKQNRVLQNEIFKLQKNKNTTDKIEKEAELIRDAVTIAKDRESSFLGRLELGAFIITIIIGLLSFWGFNNIKKSVMNNILREVNTMKKDNLNTIKRLLSEEKWRMDLMAKSNIIVVNPNKKGDDPKLSAVLKYFPHSHITEPFSSSSLINKIEERKDANKLNVVLLENSDGKWNISEGEGKIQVSKIITKTSDDLFLLYYGDGYLPRNDTNFKTLLEDNDFSDISPNDTKRLKNIFARVSATNMPSKLYPNLIDAIKYMDIIKTP